LGGRYLLGLFFRGGFALFLWSQPTALCTAKRRQMGGRTVLVTEAMAICAWSYVGGRDAGEIGLARRADLLHDCENLVFRVWVCYPTI
jgi:hypothetical protein